MNKATALLSGATQAATRPVDLNWLAAYSVAGATLGLLAGAAARIAMRAVALLAGMEAGFSLGSTLGILVLGIFGGVGGGLLCAALHRWLARPWSGPVFGAALAALMIAPLFTIGRGEAPLASPWLIPALFAPIPLIYGVLLPAGARRLYERAARSGTRRAPLAFVVAAAALSLYAFVSMTGALSGNPRMTPVTQHYFGSSAVDFGVMTERLRMWGTLFTVLYFALVAVAICVSGGDAIGRRAVLLLPLVPALLLAQSGLAWPFSSLLPESRWLLAALRATGLAALLALYITVPAVPLGTRRTVAILAAFFAAVFLLLLLSPVSGKGWAEGLLWGMLALAFGGAFYLQAAAIHRTLANVRRNQVLPVICFALAAALFLALFGAALLLPDWGFRNASALAAATGVVAYWLPWLLLPLGVLAASRRLPSRVGGIWGEARFGVQDER